MMQGVDPIYEWTRFRGKVSEWGYPFEEVKTRLKELLAMKPGEVK